MLECFKPITTKSQRRQTICDFTYDDKGRMMKLVFKVFPLIFVKPICHRNPPFDIKHPHRSKLKNIEPYADLEL